MFNIGSFSVGALFGILITALVNHYLAKSRTKENSLYQAKLEAGIKLNEAFADALVALNPSVCENEDVYDLLKNSFESHLKAVTRFRGYLKEKEKSAFDKAWHEYYCQDEKSDMPFLEQYSSHIGSHSLYKKNCSLAVERINKILSFAST